MEVKTIAVIGAGTMGRGIAYASALGEFRTVLEDVSNSVLDKAISWIRDICDEGVWRGKVDSAARDAALSPSPLQTWSMKPFAMLEAGIASAQDIDPAIKLGLNHPMGPFEMVDLVGLGVRLKILEYLHVTLGEKYRPNELLKQYVREGCLGRKTGRGVYDHSVSQK